MVIVSAGALFLPTCFSFPQEGDWAIYSAHAVCWVGANDDKVKEQIEYYENINNTIWNLTIYVVNYPNVTFSIIKNLKNGSISENYEGNLETGTPDMEMWMISPNLSVGDPIYRHGSNLTTFIRDRAVHEFAYAKRDVLYTNFSQTQSAVESYFGFFWDRETGILCGASSIIKYYDENESVLNVMINIDIVDTSLWVKDTQNNDAQNNDAKWSVIITLTALISIAILSVTILLFRKRKKKGKMGLRK